MPKYFFRSLDTLMPYCKTPTGSVARPPLGSEPPPSGRIPRLRHDLKPITLEGGLMEEVTE